jgi:hypothetical protein
MLKGRRTTNSNRGGHVSNTYLCKVETINELEFGIEAEKVQLIIEDIRLIALKYLG